MTKVREIYRCQICGNVVEVVNPGAVLSCCGEPMKLMKENTSDGAQREARACDRTYRGRLSRNSRKCGASDATRALHPMDRIAHPYRCTSSRVEARRKA